MKKNILITGASGNLGKVAVEKFLAEGYRILATVTPGKNLEFSSPEVFTYEADLTNEPSVTKALTSIINEHHSVDAALLLVGGYAPGTLATTDSSTIQKMITLNFNTAYHVARIVFQQMMTQPEGGRIVFVGARPALVAHDGKKSLPYAISKTLIFKLAELLNAEGKDKNVVSSVIVPSTIDTPENRAAMPQANFADWVKAEEIAEAMSYLVSSKANALRDPILKLYSKS